MCYGNKIENRTSENCISECKRNLLCSNNSCIGERGEISDKIILCLNREALCTVVKLGCPTERNEIVLKVSRKTSLKNKRQRSK